MSGLAVICTEHLFADSSHMYNILGSKSVSLSLFNPIVFIWLDLLVPHSAHKSTQFKSVRLLI